MLARIRLSQETGSAVAETVMITALLLIVVFGVIHLALALHIRTTLIDCAGEGARHGARTSSTIEDGAQLTRDLIRSALSDGYAENVTAQRVNHNGIDVVEVTVSAPLPGIGFLGPSDIITVEGHSLLEVHHVA